VLRWTPCSLRPDRELAAHRHLVEIAGISGKERLDAGEHRVGRLAREKRLVSLLAGPAFGDVDDVVVGGRAADEEDDAVVVRPGPAPVAALRRNSTSASPFPGCAVMVAWSPCVTFFMSAP